MIDDECSERCEATQVCAVCKRTKKPVGRDMAVAMAGSRCDDDCPGYRKEPKPGHLWPGEFARERAAIQDAKEQQR